ncbi:rhamnulokinase [Faecalicatena acetigenes]|jgi:rhamnulokinase|uniref:Rhamnulokinase n=1 Tax=Faecalicatena acetigenes TaxID=2981790 RepID=A0ABT2T9S1_9FIRM|nr:MULTISPECIES: rhamnulokinase [Lachnospiraceae]MCU6747033.1 rhamnulokinase [Faecalicatena acetigenes]RGT72307.1 rhamnulokinase [Ruminococcus sp. AF18-22]SCH59593.1 Rhamnulokinase [uncultured Clostridium sp.]
MDTYYLAIDIGASSGRHMLASVQEGKMRLEEVYRFPNGMDNKDGMLCWDVNRLFTEIKNGLKKCKEVGKIPVSMSIDTWGVDYVLLDKDDNILGDTVGYRDSRTNGMDEKVYEKISLEDLYKRTGIQKQMFNTVYQLMAVKETHPEYMENAEALLMIPDYFHFLLTGVKKNEYTNATTGQLIDPKTNDWDYELMELLGFNTKMFQPVSMPGTVVGNFTEEIQKEVGFDCTVVLPATHDTGSAVLAVPTNDDNAIYISSGTWSLMGIERKEADCSLESMKANFTNEGGYDHRFRFLKNIMGLWMIQSVKKEFTENLSFAEICAKASKETIPSIVDCNDDCFLAPKSMIEAVQKFCRDTEQQVPESVAEISAVIYNSLAKCYGDTVKEIEAITGHTYDTIYVVGGGSNAGYLNELTAKYTGKKVSAGPGEATAIGNVIVQLLHDGVFQTLAEARACVRDSFDIKEYAF